MYMCIPLVLIQNTNIYESFTKHFYESSCLDDSAKQPTQ